MDKKLLAYLEENGISVRKTKHGYLASNPHGTVTWHRQHPRHTARHHGNNIAQNFRRIGISLPREVITH